MTNSIFNSFPTLISGYMIRFLQQKGLFLNFTDFELYNNLTIVYLSGYTSDSNYIIMLKILKTFLLCRYCGSIYPDTTVFIFCVCTVTKIITMQSCIYLFIIVCDYPLCPFHFIASITLYLWNQYIVSLISQLFCNVKTIGDIISFQRLSLISFCPPFPLSLVHTFLKLSSNDSTFSQDPN